MAVTKEKLEPKNPAHLNFLRFALLDFIADFANWDNSIREEYLETARALTQSAHEALGGQPGTRPLVVDPFAGGGSIPLEALRVGADAFASDLNDVPVFINSLVLKGLAGSKHELEARYVELAELLRQRVAVRLTECYSKSTKSRFPFAFFWSRKIVCEGPGCGRIVPMIGSPVLRAKKADAIAVAIVYRPRSKSPDIELVSPSSKKVRKTVRGGDVECVCGHTTPVESVRKQLARVNGGANDAFLLAVGELDEFGKKHYRLPKSSDFAAVQRANVIRSEIEQSQSIGGGLTPFPDEPLWGKAKMNVGLYGIEQWSDAFTNRQLVQLNAFQQELRKLSEELSGPDRETLLALLAATIDKVVDYSTSLCRWVPGGEFIAATNGGEKKIGMMWDYVEAVLFSSGPGSWSNMVEWVRRVISDIRAGIARKGEVISADARCQVLPDDSSNLVFTDPPYYDAIWYSDLADLFAVWLRRSLAYVGMASTIDVRSMKEKEIIKSSFSSKDGFTEKDDAYYESGMMTAFESMRSTLAPNGICEVVFAHKTTAGWEAILGALCKAGWIVTCSWPIDTEREARMTSLGQAALASSVHIGCRPRENPDGLVNSANIGDWRDILQELPKRIHDWMPRLAGEGVVGADAIFACLGPALEIYSRYSRVEKASGEQVTLREYLEHVWAAVAEEALKMIFEGADAKGFEEDARLTAIWLWTLSTGNGTGNGKSNSDDDDEDEKSAALSGYTLEYDAARKIAQGLGAHLETLSNLVEVKGDKAVLLPVAARTRHLFGKDEAKAPARKPKKDPQLNLLASLQEVQEESGSWGEKNAPPAGTTVLDRVHQSMILFAANRGEAIKRFLVEDGVGKDHRFWKLAQSLSALYPKDSDEKRWVDGLLGKKKSLGF